MENSISVLGWVLIIFLIVFIIAINVGLFLGTKKKKSAKTNWVDKMHAAGQTVKNPFQKENSKMQELSEKVEKLQQNIKKTADESADQTHAGDLNE